MRWGHLCALLGAMLMAVGTTLLPWQSFELSELVASGYQLPAGQVLLALAVLVVAASLGGLFSRRRRELATATLMLSVFGAVWAVIAHTGRGTAFAVAPAEVVEMLGGYSLAVFGLVAVFLGSLVALAAEARPDPSEPVLRVALLWRGTVVKEQEILEPRPVNVGEGVGNDLVAPASTLPWNFPLISPRAGGGYELGVVPELAGGEVTFNGERMSLAKLVEHPATSWRDGVPWVPLSERDWGIIHLSEEIQVFFNFVRHERRSVRSGLLAFDEYVAASIAVSAAVQVGVILLATFGWQEAAMREVTIDPMRPAHIELVLRAELPESQPETKPEVEPEQLKQEVEPEEADDAERFDEPVDVVDKRRLPSKNVGGTNKSDKPGSLIDLLRRKQGKLGAEITQIIGGREGLQVNKLAAAFDADGPGGNFGIDGTSGLAMATGPSGGPDGWAYGRMTTAGCLGSKCKGGRRVSHRPVRLGPKGKAHVPKCTGCNVGPPQPIGDFCKRDNIRSVVRRRAGSIRACYERRLLVSPGLKGKLTTRWTIQLDGTVTAASAAGSLTDSAVRRCILKVVRRMRFATPKGGLCVVKWPFVFDAR